jgi:beta-lactam-binding protein with PASTA domain
MEQQIATLTQQLKRANAKRPLPLLRGESRDEVGSLATQYGWQLTVKQKESVEPEGTVLSQQPPKGTVMHLGALISIVVAKPLPPRMPNLVGQTRQDAESLATANSWKLTVTRKVSSQLVGTILSQTPQPGAFMRGAAKFSIVIAKKSPGSCDPNYTLECLDPNATDYDCAGGSGNGPLYVFGTVRVVGVDHFGLDRDNDGYGCE